MKTIGIVIGIAALVAAVVGLRSMGDIKRYLKIRSM